MLKLNSVPKQNSLPSPTGWSVSNVANAQTACDPSYIFCRHFSSVANVRLAREPTSLPLDELPSFFSSSQSFAVPFYFLFYNRNKKKCYFHCYIKRTSIVTNIYIYISWPNVSRIRCCVWKWAPFHTEISVNINNQPLSSNRR